jgi:hypothetical protein
VLPACGGEESSSAGQVITLASDPNSPPPAVSLGPFQVSNAVVHTRYTIAAGSRVVVTAEGLIDFGGAVLGIGAPKVGPDGDNAYAPSDYPAPNLHKNSLICQVAGIWYQGGVDTDFVPTQSGELILRPNDANLEDNSRSWTVTVTIFPA